MRTGGNVIEAATRVPVVPAAESSPPPVTTPPPSPASESDGAQAPGNNGRVARAPRGASTLRSSNASTVPAPVRATLSAHQTLPATNLVTTATVIGTALVNLIQFGVILTISASSAVPPGPFTTTPTLRLNGFDIIPTSVEEITSFYGRWAYMPGAPGLIQGRQTFGVVDPKTGEQAGTFDALVSRGNGIGFTELLVMSSEGPADGPVPPAGSLISSLRFGPFGYSYSALPTPSGNKVSFRITTPFGEIPVPFPFDNAKGIADRTVDNRPMRLGNGYSIAPVDPTGETITATSGIMPGFMAVQGNQVFGVYDSDGHEVGSFEGIFTTTADLFFYTQAVLVTANEGANVGTGPGQVPPVGSVYNVIYLGTDKHFLLYSSLPTPDGTDISVIRVRKDKVTASALTLIDASTPPAMPLAGAGGFTFVPVADLQPSGVNGLPPREVEIQGYRQFDVYDPTGARIGTVDADYFAQWDAFGVRSQALLITRVAEGGSAVPPAGSIFNFVKSGHRGFGATHSTVPQPSGNLTSLTLLTPWGNIPFISTFTPVAHRTPVRFYSPFAAA